MNARVAGTFRAFEVPNYRRFFAGQIVSVSGTWMQTVAQGWLVLQLSDSGALLGLVTAAQFVPMLLLGPWGGVLADRVDKRRLIIAGNAVAAVLAAVLGALTVTGVVEVWMVAVIAALMGTVNALDVPSRQAFVTEMVGPDLLPNAVSLNTTIMHGSRIVGPGLAGLVIGGVGLGACFLLNAVSYLAAIVALAGMDTGALTPAERVPRSAGQLRAGLRHVWAEPALRTPLLLMAVIGTFTYEFQVTLPVLARDTFGQDAGGYSALLMAMSVGAVVGGLASAASNGASHRRLGRAALGFGVAVLVLAAVPSFGAALVVLPVLGALSVRFITLSNATLQLTASPEMRGRVVALYAVAFLGTTPVGGPIVGVIGELAGGRAPLVLGGLVAVGAALAARPSLLRSAAVHDRDRPGAAPDEPPGIPFDEVAGDAVAPQNAA